MDRLQLKELDSPKPEPEPSFGSMKRDSSAEDTVGVTDGQMAISHQQRAPAPSLVSLKSSRSMDHPMSFKVDHHVLIGKRPALDSGDDPFNSIFKENVGRFVKDELKRLQNVLRPDFPERQSKHLEDEGLSNSEEEEQRKIREAFLKITLHFLRMEKEEELVYLGKPLQEMQ